MVKTGKPAQDQKVKTVRRKAAVWRKPSRDAAEEDASTSSGLASVTNTAANQTLVNCIVCAEMVYYCFEVISKHLVNKSRSHCENVWSPPVFENASYPLFVTWRSEKRLRGCIGTFHAIPLHKGLRDYAITSAFEDSRFSPITIDEVQRLHCTVSLLTDFEATISWKDWEIGVHGVRIEFNTGSGKRSYHATYLPEVAREQNWNHTETIDSLIRKSGYSGSICDNLRKRIMLTRYRSRKITKSYGEYKDATDNILRIAEVSS